MLTVFLLAGLLLVAWLVLCGNCIFNYQPGHFAPVQWQRVGGQLALLNIKSHSIDLSVLLHDVTSTGSGGGRARIAGPLDAAGTVNLDLDMDQPPYADPPLILSGVRGVAGFGFTLVRQLQVPMIVEKLHFAAEVDREVMWSTDMKFNQLAGVLIYPPL